MVVGLTPRLVSALWFALAGCFPVAFFFHLFGRLLHVTESHSLALWMYVVLPVTAAALCGFTLGAKILDPWLTETPLQAAGRGLLVAITSYVVHMATIVFMLSAAAELSSVETSVTGLAAGIVGLFFFGLIFVGWLVVIAGSLAGWLLYFVSRLGALESRLINADMVEQSVAKKWTAVAVILFLTCSTPFVTRLRADDIRADNKNKERERMNTEIIWASTDGDTTRVKSLLAAGADPNADEGPGWTPLMWAARNRHARTAQILLEHGANPNVSEDGYMTPLTWAANEGDLPLVRALLAHGANVDASTRTGYTPLMYASMMGHAEVVRFLLEKGANVNARTGDGGQTVLSLTAARREVVSKRDPEARVTRGDVPDGDPASPERARRRHDEVIQLLIRAGAKL